MFQIASEGIQKNFSQLVDGELGVHLHSLGKIEDIIGSTFLILFKPQIMNGNYIKKFKKEFLQGWKIPLHFCEC